MQEAYQSFYLPYILLCIFWQLLCQCQFQLLQSESHLLCEHLLNNYRLEAWCNEEHHQYLYIQEDLHCRHLNASNPIFWKLLHQKFTNFFLLLVNNLTPFTKMVSCQHCIHAKSYWFQLLIFLLHLIFWQIIQLEMGLMATILKISRQSFYSQELLDFIFSLCIMAFDYYRKQKLCIVLFFLFRLYGCFKGINWIYLWFNFSYLNI